MQGGWQVFVEIPGKPPLELSPGESVLGRSRTCAVHIPESTVSRQHAKLVVGEEGKVSVQDLGSSNGTFVNGDKIEGSRDLANGDRVIVGEAEVVVHILPPVEPGDATMKVSIPPLSAPYTPPAPPPAAGRAAASRETEPYSAPSPPPLPTPPAPPAPPAMAAAGPGATVAVAAAAPPPSPAARPLEIDPPLHAPRVPPPPAPAPPPVAPAAAAPTALPPPVAAAPAKPAGDVLPSIQEIEKMPLPPAKKAAAPAAAASGAVAVEPAGFWIRVAAALIDGLIGSVIVGLFFALGFAAVFVLPPEIGLALSSALTFVGVLAFAFLFQIWFPAKQGRTPGKKLLGLWIYSDETPPGRGLGWNKALLRFVGHLACSFTFSLGYVMVAFTSKKQGLHDLIAKTYVGRSLK